MDKLKDKPKLLSTKNIMYFFNFSLFLFFIAYGIVIGISGNDFWWHAKIGEWICENKQIPTTGIFGWWTELNNYSWVSHEWLSEIIFFKIKDIFSDVGITIFAVSLFFLSQFIVMKSTEKKWEENYVFGLLWFLYNIATYTLLVQCRPYLFNFIFLALEISFIYDLIKNEKSKKIFFTPLIAILWVNTHGGSSNLSYLLILLVIITGIIPNFSFYKLQNNKLSELQLKKLFIVFFSTILANIINPHGINVLTYTFNFSNNLDYQVIQEWQPLDLKTTLGIILVVSIVISVIILIVTDKKIKLLDFILFGGFAFLAFRSARFEFLFFIVCSFFIFEYLPKEINFINRKEVNILTLIMSVAFIVFSSTMLIISENHVYIKTNLSEDIIEDVKAFNPERLFNEYNYGEELIWNDIPVFVDSRASDLYSQGNTLNYYFAINNLSSDYIPYDEENEEPLFDIDYLWDEKYKFDSALIFSSSPLNTYLDKKEGWEIKSQKDDTVFWIRK